MATSTFGTPLSGAIAYTFEAGSTVEAGQIVFCATDNAIDKATGSVSSFVGVACNGGDAGDSITVTVSGPALVQVAAINFASEAQFNCTANSDGRAVPVSSNGQYIAVRLLPGTSTDTSLAAGDLCPCVIAFGTAHA